MSISKWSKLLKTLLTKRDNKNRTRNDADQSSDSIMNAIYDMNGHYFPPDKLVENIKKIEDPIILERLSRHPNKHVRWAVAKNGNTPATVLKKLNRKVRLGVEEIPDETLKKLRRDLRKGVGIADSEALAFEETPDDILEKLSTDRTWKVRQAVAEHEETPDDILEKLSTDRNWKVRQAVAKNENTPVHVLEILKKNVNRKVSGSAAQAEE